MQPYKYIRRVPCSIIICILRSKSRILLLHREGSDFP